MKTISVKFTDGYSDKVYAYLTEDESIKNDDAVVVDSPNGGYKVVRVVSVEETVESVTKASKWIVQRVDDTEYKERIAKEKRKAVLEVKLAKAVEEARKKVDYNELAKLNPEIAKMVEEMNSI